MTKYIVWIGGVVDYEGTDSQKAKEYFDSWVKMGYDDVILEELNND
jgi:hypothetical protein